MKTGQGALILMTLLHHRLADVPLSKGEVEMISSLAMLRELEVETIFLVERVMTI